jgi:DNA-binding response OmpR family regulator
MEDQALRERTNINYGADLDEAYGSQRQRVLVVEDEPDTIFLLKHILRSAGYNVLGATTGPEAIRKLAEVKPHLVLLDLMMPGMDGWETFGFLRKISDVPVMVVSAVANKEEVVRALHLGVDDYLIKPFLNAEVVARVEAILRRSNAVNGDMERMAFPEIDLVVDYRSQEISSGSQRLQLTGREFAVIGLLARAAPAIVSYHDIAMQIWEEDSPEARNRIKYLVHLLRRKFERLPNQPDFIQNIDRIGYKLRMD